MKKNRQTNNLLWNFFQKPSLRQCNRFLKSAYIKNNRAFCLNHIIYLFLHAKFCDVIKKRKNQEVFKKRKRTEKVSKNDKNQNVSEISAIAFPTTITQFSYLKISPDLISIGISYKHFSRSSPITIQIIVKIASGNRKLTNNAQSGNK